MSVPASKPVHTISVRDLVEFVLRASNCACPTSASSSGSFTLSQGLNVLTASLIHVGVRSRKISTTD